jgi:formylglycine-generating enzyme required for sulfatase activity
VQEKALKPGDPSFKECTDCPEMVVVPTGSFMMGSRDSDEARPLHTVTIAKPLAVSKYELTFAEWDACEAQGSCKHAGDAGFGRGQQPVINVSWDEAKQYVTWLSWITGKTYRLLAEAEYEYAARGGQETKYPWGDNIKLNGTAMANCLECGSQWDGKQTAPVGSYAPNRFGLHDMVGNVMEWTEDCYHDSYDGAPSDGSAWLEAPPRPILGPQHPNPGDYCTHHVVRGGAWDLLLAFLHSANRAGTPTVNRNDDLGFRVARTLDRR